MIRTIVHHKKNTNGPLYVISKENAKPKSRSKKLQITGKKLDLLDKHKTNDICFTVNYVSKFMDESEEVHL
jgi:hypothetical protein